MDFQENEPTYNNLNQQGYFVISGFLSNEECKILKENFTQSTMDLVFTRQGFDVDPKDPTALKLLTDMKLRKTKLGEKASDVVWRDGNTRTPLISKSCGMVHVHYDEALLDNITFNPRLYNEASKVMGTKYLVHSYGPERFSIKAPGSTDMPQHIDANLFNDKVNYDFRIQCLVTIEIDTTTVPSRDSGTLCLLTYFHHYWDFARELFHPLRGLFPMKEEVTKSRFFILPSDKKDRDDFNRDYLPNLKKYGRLYTIYLKTEEIPVNEQSFCRRFFEDIRGKDVTVPSDVSYLEKMDWKPINLEPGDVVFWHQHLPHQSLRNRSKKTPRIAAYYSVFPVKKGWYGSEHQKWVERQFKRCEFYYGVDAGKYTSTTPVNIEELKMIKDIKYISDKTRSSQFHRRISGQESWWEKENMAESSGAAANSTCNSLDVKNLCDALIENLKENRPLIDIKKKHPNAVKLPFPNEEKPCSKKEELVHSHLIFEDEYWSYVPSLIPHNYFDMLFPQLEKVCKSYTVYKNISSRRISALFAEDKKEVIRRAQEKINGFDYIDTPSYEWSTAPEELIEIKKFVENYFGFKIDYVLCHIYRGLPPDGKNPGSDSIGLHQDKEALNSEVISVSLGVTRKFQFREINDEKCVFEEFNLKSGDVVHMFGPRSGETVKKHSCQKMYKHQVLPMTISDLTEHIENSGIEIPKGRKTYKSLGEIIRKNNIPPDRINLTFRQYEN